MEHHHQPRAQSVSRHLCGEEGGKPGVSRAGLDPSCAEPLPCLSLGFSVCQTGVRLRLRFPGPQTGRFKQQRGAAHRCGGQSPRSRCQQGRASWEGAGKGPTGASALTPGRRVTQPPSACHLPSVCVQSCVQSFLLIRTLVVWDRVPPSYLGYLCPGPISEQGHRLRNRELGLPRVVCGDTVPPVPVPSPWSCVYPCRLKEGPEGRGQESPPRRAVPRAAGLSIPSDVDSYPELSLWRCLSREHSEPAGTESIAWYRAWLFNRPTVRDSAPPSDGELTTSPVNRR